MAIALYGLFLVCGACTGPRVDEVEESLDGPIPCLTLRNPYLTDDFIQQRRKSSGLMYHVIDTVRIQAALEIQYYPLGLRMIMSESDFLARDISFEDPWVLLSAGRAMLLGVNGDDFAEYGGEYHWLTPDKERWDTFWSTRYLWGNYSPHPMEEELYLRVVMDEATYMILEDSLSTRAPITGCVIGLPIIVAYPLN